MACIDMLKAGTKGDVLFYNLDAAVGRGCQNNVGDVLLVQYFIAEAFEDRGRFPDAPDAPAFTGAADPLTLAAIEYYQKKQKARGKTIATDGRIDPVRDHQVRGSISNTQYTIIFLNLEYQQSRPAEYKNLGAASDCPPGLKEEVTPRFLSF